ncbi:NAD(P)-dependent oxidoreductase [Thermoleophilia bacterium SCSIO 60948]|nr:NAD(P)-dependent oxidoreductase [Thermoleophilia bacterium SCSIO 60948]
MTDQNAVAVLGTGIMGGAMARNLAADGFEVRAWNRDGSKAEALTDAGVIAKDSPAEAVDGADVVVTMLADGAATRSVMDEQGALAAMDPRAAWVQTATVGIAATEEFEGLAGGCGIGFVDAPVLGTKKPAEDGELVVLASGREECRGKVDPVFDAIGKKTLWLGDAGQGSRLKLVLNSWIVNLTAALGEAVATAEALGVDPEAFIDTIDGAPMGTPYANVKAPLMLSGSYEPSFPLELATKDARLVLDAVGDAADLRLVRAALEANEAAVELGYGEDDMAAVAEAARPSRD